MKLTVLVLLALLALSSASLQDIVKKSIQQQKGKVSHLTRQKDLNLKF